MAVRPAGSSPQLPDATRRALKLLDTLAAELRRRRPHLRRHDAYYRGEHKLTFASDQFSKHFAKRYTQFADNWVSVVADAPTERLAVSGIRPGGVDVGGDQELWEDWLRNGADEESSQAFLEAIIGGRAFGSVWADADGEPLLRFEHPAQAIVSYDHETRARLAGLKLWADEEYEYATLYTPDAVWKFQRAITLPEPKNTFGGPYDRTPWDSRQPSDDDTWPIPNPLGAVPLVELRNRPRLAAEPMSDVAGAIAMQDAVNLIWAYLFNAADLASLPQRIILGAERPEIPVLDESGKVVGTRPVDLERFAVDRVLWVEDPNAKAEEWGRAMLDQFIATIEMAVTHLGAQTRTPPHYMLAKLVNIAAEALKAAETGLAKRTAEKTLPFGHAIREMFRLAALVRGDEDKARAVARGSVLWRDVEIRSDTQLADQLVKLKSLGFSFEFLAERYGLSPAEIAREIERRRREAEEDPLLTLAGRELPALPAGDPAGGADGATDQ